MKSSKSKLKDRIKKGLEIINSVFSFLQINDDDIKNIVLDKFGENLVRKNIGVGPTKTSNWITEQVIMTTVPRTCDDVNKLIQNGVKLIISLQEQNEQYQYCEPETNNIIFWRYRIQDFNTPTSLLDTKALIDNLLNYLSKDKNNKIAIHCLGGHGRTGTISCCLIAILLFLKEHDIDEIINKKLSAHDTRKDILELVNKLFLKAQSYVMLSLRFFRKSDSPAILSRNDLKTIKIPEIASQDHFVKDMIEAYINFYIEYGFIYKQNYVSNDALLKTTGYEGTLWKQPKIDKYVDTLDLTVSNDFDLSEKVSKI